MVIDCPHLLARIHPAHAEGADGGPKCPSLPPSFPHYDSVRISLSAAGLTNGRKKGGGAEGIRAAFAGAVGRREGNGIPARVSYSFLWFLCSLTRMILGDTDLNDFLPIGFSFEEA